MSIFQSSLVFLRHVTLRKNIKTKTDNSSCDSHTITNFYLVLTFFASEDFVGERDEDDKTIVVVSE